jgi:L-threonylcarbamoyladenylate synthase
MNRTRSELASLRYHDRKYGASIIGKFDGFTFRVESTIVAFLDGPPQLLRPGGISLETLMARLGPVQVGGAIAVPGTLPSHYAPRAKVELIPHGTPGADIPAGAPEDHARALYDALRTLDARGATTIVCEMADSVGIGVAVNDRLRRAAHR